MRSNRFGIHEWAGAFGDLGTLLPFVMAYLSVLQLEPFGVLFGLGVSMIATGLVFRTPFPVQPMKAIGAAAVAQSAGAAIITPAAVHGAGLVSGLLWLLLGATGAARHLGRWVGPAVAQGVMLGLGAALMVQAVELMSRQAGLAVAGLLLFLALLRRPRIPAIFVLLILGIAWTAFSQPQALLALQSLSLELRWPSWHWPALSLDDLLVGAVVLALPQAPLTLGNAIIGIKTENNRLFPDRPVSERKVALSTGVMNLFGSAVGGVPMCHGAGGMAGHVAFGARTGGAVVILGSLLLVSALLFSGSVMTLFGLIPPAVLGAILFVTGAQLAQAQLRQQRQGPASWSILAATALLCLWHVALGMLAGVVLQAILLRRAATRSV